MTYSIVVEHVLEQEIVHAILIEARSVEEMRSFLEAVARWSADHAAVLVELRAAPVVFHVEQEGLVNRLRQIARSPAHRIALLADSRDLRASLEYLEFIARQRGLDVRCAAREDEALRWLSDPERP